MTKHPQKCTDQTPFTSVSVWLDDPVTKTHQDQFYHLFVQVHRAEHLGGGEKTFRGSASQKKKVFLLIFVFFRSGITFF